MYSNEAYVLEALSNGASAYVLKDSSSGDLVHAVREAAAGRRCLSPPLSDRAIEVYQLMHKLDLHTQAELIRLRSAGELFLWTIDLLTFPRRNLALFIFQAIQNGLRRFCYPNRSREIYKMCCLRISFHFVRDRFIQCCLYYFIFCAGRKPSAYVSVGRPPHQPYLFIVITVIWRYCLLRHLWGSSRIRMYPVFLRRVQIGVRSKVVLDTFVKSSISA